jgi:cation:H+ antiporter
MLFAAGFAFCALVILFAGKKLSTYGELLASKANIGKAFIGLFLMSAVTSLPELMVGISSVRLVGSPDLATGDVLGSCAFNLMLLVIMDAITSNNQPLL